MDDPKNHLLGDIDENRVDFLTPEDSAPKGAENFSMNQAKMESPFGGGAPKESPANKDLEKFPAGSAARVLAEKQAEEERARNEFVYTTILTGKEVEHKLYHERSLNLQVQGKILEAVIKRAGSNMRKEAYSKGIALDEEEVAQRIKNLSAEEAQKILREEFIGGEKGWEAVDRTTPNLRIKEFGPNRSIDEVLRSAYELDMSLNAAAHPEQYEDTRRKKEEVKPTESNLKGVMEKSTRELKNRLQAYGLKMKDLDSELFSNINPNFLAFIKEAKPEGIDQATEDTAHIESRGKNRQIALDVDPNNATAKMMRTRVGLALNELGANALSLAYLDHYKFVQGSPKSLTEAIELDRKVVEEAKGNISDVQKLKEIKVSIGGGILNVMEAEDVLNNLRDNIEGNSAGQDKEPVRNDSIPEAKPRQQPEFQGTKLEATPQDKVKIEQVEQKLEEQRIAELARVTRQEGMGQLYGHTYPFDKAVGSTGYYPGMGFIKGESVVGNYDKYKELFEVVGAAQAPQHEVFDPYVNKGRQVWVIAGDYRATKTEIWQKRVKGGLFGLGEKIVTHEEQKTRSYKGERGELHGENGWRSYSYFMLTENPGDVRVGVGTMMNIVVPPEIAQKIDKEVEADPMFPDRYFKALFPGVVGENPNTYIKRKEATEIAVVDLRKDPAGRTGEVRPYSQPIKY